ncbi:Cerato-platanin domain-containing protein [Trichoderma ceciliae]
MFLSRFFPIATILIPASAETATVTSNKLYDDPLRPLSEVACWRKGTGFMPNLDWKLQKDAGAFIGIPIIQDLSSAACFSCWEVNCNGIVGHFLALDGTDSGFVISLKAMQSLANSEAQGLMSLDANVTEVDILNCGISTHEIHKYDF